MTKKRKILLICVLAAILLAAICVRPVAHIIIELFEPGQEPMNNLFKLAKGEVALVVDDETLREYAIKEGEEIYVPVSVASGSMDQRIYVDTVEKCLSYATKEGVICAKAGDKKYSLGKEQNTTAMPILYEKEKEYYVALSFIGQHTSCYYKLYKNPDRLVIMSDREAVYTIGTLTEDTRVRKGPNSKYKYYVELKEGDRVFVETDIKQENEYMAVTTQDGISGYVPKERIIKKEETTWKFEKNPESFGQIAMQGKICLAWHQVMSQVSSGSLPSSINEAKAMNVLSPTWYALNDNEGNFDSLANSAYVSAAHSAGKKVWGLINDFGKNGKKIKLKKVLGITSNRNRLVNNLVASAIQHQLDGINIDFENVTKDTASAYLQFLRELTLRCHANDLIVSVDNYCPANYNSFYDLAEQGRIVDYVVLMAYDEHYNGSEESGSVSSLPFVEKGIKGVLDKVPKERTIVALPFYTRLWKESKDGGKPTSEPFGMSNAESVLRANEAESKWDEATGQYYAQYKSGGATYKIWLEEETSLGRKLALVNKNKVAGAAFWKLGFERAVTWSTIRDALK